MQCSAVGGSNQFRGDKVWWVAVETRPNGSLIGLLDSHLLPQLRTVADGFQEGRCRAHAFPVTEIMSPPSIWNHLHKAGGWRGLAQAQAMLRAGMGIVKLIQVVGSLDVLTFGYH